MIKILRSIFLWAVMMLIIIVYGHMIIPLQALFSKDKKKTYHGGGVVWSKILLFLAGIDVKVDGIENIPKDKAVIFMPNHQGHWDYPILFNSLPRRFAFVAKKELFSVPFLGKYMENAGNIPIDRQAGRSAHESLLKVTNAIKEGDSILIFPEGTRTWDGKVGEFKRGSFHVAFETGAPIVPVAISGSYKIMKRHSWVVNPGKIELKIGKPISLQVSGKHVTKEDYVIAMEMVKNSIVEMLGAAGA